MNNDRQLMVREWADIKKLKEEMKNMKKRHYFTAF